MELEIFGFDLTQMVYWHWLVIGLGFLVLEVFSMGFFFLWFGLAGLLVGAVLYFVPELAWTAQFSIWGLLSVAAAFAWRVFKKKNPQIVKSDEPNLNRRGHQYVGRVFTLEGPVVNGKGKLKVDDSIWKIEADQDLKAGAKVKVTGVDGTVLTVKKG